MEKTDKHTTGSIKLSEDVLIRIAETAACEIEGVCAVNNKLVPTSAFPGFKAPVRVKVNGEAAAICFEISVLEGYNAIKVAEDIQRSVKSAVQNMTGFTVTKVDVLVAGVSFDNSKPAVAE